LKPHDKKGWAPLSTLELCELVARAGRGAGFPDIFAEFRATSLAKLSGASGKWGYFSIRIL
jgi:hypothetical protein